MLITAIPLTQGNCRGCAASSGECFILLHSTHRALPAAPVASGHSKRAISTQGTTKTFIECSGQAPQDPSAADNTSGTRASARAAASAHPTGTCTASLEVSHSFHREMLALVSLGLMCPHPGTAKEIMEEIQRGQ